MPTLVVTFAFTASGDVTAWTFNAGDAAQVRTHDATNGSPTAGCVRIVLDGKNKNALIGDMTRTMTFEAMGVPSGSTITGITAASMRTRTTVFTTGTSCQYAAYITPSGFSQITLSALREPTAVDGNWVTTNGTNATGLSIPSNTSCALEVDTGQRTGNSNSAQIVSLFDTLTFTITYDAPVTRNGTLAGTLASITGAFTGSHSVPATRDGTLDGTLDAITGDFTGEHWPYILPEIRFDITEVASGVHAFATQSETEGAPMQIVMMGSGA